MKPIISFAPGILCLIRRAVSFTSLFSCRRRFVAAEQGVLLKAASCPGRLPLHLGGPASWAGTKLPAAEFFFFSSIQTPGERCLGPRVCPDSSWEQRRCCREPEVPEVRGRHLHVPDSSFPGCAAGRPLALEGPSGKVSAGLNERPPPSGCGTLCSGDVVGKAASPPGAGEDRGWSSPCSRRSSEPVSPGALWPADFAWGGTDVPQTVSGWCLSGCPEPPLEQWLKSTEWREGEMGP